MATKQTQQKDRELRRLVRAERWEDVKVLLMTRLEQNPADTVAKAELQRLINGEPLRISLSAAERAEAEASDARKDLLSLYQKHPLETLKILPKLKLRQLLKQLKQAESVMDKAGYLYPVEHRAYIAELKKRLRKLVFSYSRKLIQRAAIILLSLGIIFGARVYLKQRAIQKAQLLTTALEQKDIQSLQSAKHEANSKINRFFCPDIAETLVEAEHWEKQTRAEYNRLRTIITELETNKRNYAALTTDALHTLDSRVHRLVIGKEELLPKWQKLYKRETVRLETLKNEQIMQLAQNMPQLPEFSGCLDTDETAISQYIELLKNSETQANKIIKDFRATQAILTPISQALKTAFSIKSEIQQTRKLLQSLSPLTQYEDYYRVWQQFSPQIYPPAITLASAKEAMLPPNDIQYHVQDPEKRYQARLIQAAEACLIHGKSSFTAEFPATQEQINIPADLFSAPSYQYKIYILKKKDGTTWYSTIEPKLDKSNFIIYTRSSIDPHFSPEHYKEEFQNDGSLELTCTDSSQLLPKLNITKDSFFLEANLPDLLTNTLNLPVGNHPVLAQAYIYQCLMKLIAKHPYELLNGIKFSPTLRQHAASFKALVEKHHISLHPGCWLTTNEKILAAEKDFAEWFQKHRGHDYRAEMAQNFRSAFGIQAQYCGYVTPEGQIAACRPIRPQCNLWYISKDGLIHSQEPSLPGALPYSPVFCEKRVQALP